MWGENTLSQSFTARADRLAMVRVWLAPTAGAPEVEVRLAAADGARADAARPTWGKVLYAGRVRLEGEGRHYAFTFPPIADSQGREFLLTLSAPSAPEDAPVAARVGYVDAVGGLMYLNEFRAAGDLDFTAWHRGRPGVWTLRTIGERFLPRLLVQRVGQYKPAWAKGGTFAALTVALVVGSVALLWLGWPGGPSRRAAWGAAALLIGTAVLVGWRDAAIGLGIGERRVPLSPVELEEPELAGATLVTHDLLSALEWAKREPEPRRVQAEWVGDEKGLRWPAIVAPGTSRIAYRLEIPPDAALRWRLRRVGDSGEAAVTVDREVAWRGTGDVEGWQEGTVDLRPWAGRSVSLVLRSSGGGTVQWAYPQVIAARTWLRAGPPLPGEGGYRADLSHLGLDGGDQIDLLGYAVEPGQRLVRVTLYWRARSPVAEDYTVFVHALDASGEGVGQHDARPVDGIYPTYLWPRGSVVVDRHEVPVSSVPTRFAVGLYRLDTMERLPARRADGSAWPNAQVIVDLEAEDRLP